MLLFCMCLYYVYVLCMVCAHWSVQYSAWVCVCVCVCVFVCVHMIWIYSVHERLYCMWHVYIYNYIYVVCGWCRMIKYDTGVCSV